MANEADAAQLLCSREGINVVIAASIEPSGSGYVFNVRALDPLSYLTLAERSKTIATKAEVFKAADSLVAELRDDLSRIPAETVQALSMETFTAASLEAMKIYAHAQDLVLAGKETRPFKNISRPLKKTPSWDAPTPAWRLFTGIGARTKRQKSIMRKRWP